MIMDSQELFSGAIAADGTRTAQAITATANSTNVLDLRNAASPLLVDEGLSGPEVWLNVQVLQAFNTLTSLTIAFVSSAATTLTTPTTHYSTTIALAGLTANTSVVRVLLPSGDYLRYAGMIYTVNGAAPTTGSVYAFITQDIQRNVIYPSGYTVDV